MRSAQQPRRVACGILLTTLLLANCAMRRPGSPLTPGFNLYSKEQDIELGRQAAQEVRQQLELVQNRELQNYVMQVGRRLASMPGSDDYPYSFTLLNDKSINAFALPGGPIFLNSGLLTAADNEAQVAGVIAHEIAHVALRHGTSQASKANLIQLPAQVAGSVFGRSTAGRIGQLGVGLGLNLLMLRYSRSAESEADALGTQIMAQARYDPVAMAQFFEKLQQEGGGRAPEFLSDHPDPGNRMQAVQAEIQTLPPQSYRTNQVAGNFERFRQVAAQLPPPRRPQREVLAGNSFAPQASVNPQFKQWRSERFAVACPQDWETFGSAASRMWAMAPRAGLLRSPYGNVMIGYGAVASYYQTQNRDLGSATKELLANLQQSDPALRLAGESRGVSLNGEMGLITPLAGRSPYGGPESGLLLTAVRPQGLFYMFFAAPSSPW